jgi:hypothetical protein
MFLTSTEGVRLSLSLVVRLGQPYVGVTGSLMLNLEGCSAFLPIISLSVSSRVRRFVRLSSGP